MRTRHATFAGALAAGLLISASAFTQELVVGVYGGSWLDNTKVCFGNLLEKETGARVSYVPGNSVQTAAKLRATKGRSEYDVAYMDLQIAKQAKAEGLLTSLDPAKIKNLPDIFDTARDGATNNFVGMSFSGTAIAYNPKAVKEAPTSWGQLWDPMYKGKLALPDISGTSGQQFLIAAARLRGGSLTDVEPGFTAIKELKGSFITLYTQADQIVSLMERGDIIAAPWYVDRVGAAASRGIPVAVSFPKEGAIGLVSTVSIPAGAKNVALAERFIDLTLSPEGQKCFAEKQYGGPTNKKVELPAELGKLLPYGETLKTMYFPDTDEVARNLPRWAERWGREIAR